MYVLKLRHIRASTVADRIGTTSAILDAVLSRGQINWNNCFFERPHHPEHACAKKRRRGQLRKRCDPNLVSLALRIKALHPLRH